MLMRRLFPVACLVVVCALFASVAPVAAAPAENACPPTPADAAGPFGRGLPPLRAKIGTGHVLSGVVLSALDCRPLARARVELWQANRNGRYTRATSATVLTDRSGRFRFEGPNPRAYEGREPHIHLRISASLHEPLLTRYVPARGARSGQLRLVLEPAAL
jgi:protocatechuate 3,4-dioxygenase beta subunit